VSRESTAFQVRLTAARERGRDVWHEGAVLA